MPTIPESLWMLWNEGKDGSCHWVIAMDGPEDDCLMVFIDGELAAAEALRQNDLYLLNCRAVQVK